MSSGVLVTVFSMPTLTEGGGTGMTGVSQADYQAAQQAELSYCRTASQSLDCQCFARTSGMILAYKSDSVRSSDYTDRHALARSQAEARC